MLQEKDSVSITNVSVVFDSHMKFEGQVSSICKASFFHIRNTSRIQKCLSVENTRTLVYASPVGWIMGMHCCTDFLNISLQNFKLFWIVLPVWFYAKRNMTMQLLCWSSFIGSLLVSALFLRSYYWHLRRLRTFALIVSEHPYCARKSTFHVMHRARALSTKMNNDRADGHCYSFDWI